MAYEELAPESCDLWILPVGIKVVTDMKGGESIA